MIEMIDINKNKEILDKTKTNKKLLDKKDINKKI